MEMSLPKLLIVSRGTLRQKEMADRLGIPVGTYRKYESGKRTPNKLALAELERRIADLK